MVDLVAGAEDLRVGGLGGGVLVEEERVDGVADFEGEGAEGEGGEGRGGGGAEGGGVRGGGGAGDGGHGLGWLGLLGWMLGWLLWERFGWLCRGGLFSGGEVGARAMKGFQAVGRIGG